MVVPAIHGGRMDQAIPLDILILRSYFHHKLLFPAQQGDESQSFKYYQKENFSFLFLKDERIIFFHIQQLVTFT